MCGCDLMHFYFTEVKVQLMIESGLRYAHLKFRYSRGLYQRYLILVHPFWHQQQDYFVGTKIVKSLKIASEDY